MDNEIASPALAPPTEDRPPLKRLRRPQEGAAGLSQQRAAALRSLFPMCSVGRAQERNSRIARQVYALLGQATTEDELERRLPLPIRYPSEWIQRVWLNDRPSVLVRPVLPTDAALLQTFVRSLSAATRRNRFHGPVVDLPEPVLRYMTQVDYINHLAFVGEVRAGTAPRQVAEARWVRREDEPDHADFAIVIDDGYQCSGLGTRLMDLLRRSAAAQGVRRLCGDVLKSNQRMTRWLQAHGWALRLDPLDPRVLCAELRLDDPDGWVDSPRAAWPAAA